MLRSRFCSMVISAPSLLTTFVALTRLSHTACRWAEAILILRPQPFGFFAEVGQVLLDQFEVRGELPQLALHL